LDLNGYPYRESLLRRDKLREPDPEARRSGSLTLAVRTEFAPSNLKPKAHETGRA